MRLWAIYIDGRCAYRDFESHDDADAFTRQLDIDRAFFNVTIRPQFKRTTA